MYDVSYSIAVCDGGCLDKPRPDIDFSDDRYFCHMSLDNKSLCSLIFCVKYILNVIPVVVLGY